jgi:hypothetical protein
VGAGGAEVGPPDMAGGSVGGLVPVLEAEVDVNVAIFRKKLCAHTHKTVEIPGGLHTWLLLWRCYYLLLL